MLGGHEGPCKDQVKFRTGKVWAYFQASLLQSFGCLTREFAVSYRLAYQYC